MKPKKTGPSFWSVLLWLGKIVLGLIIVSALLAFLWYFPKYQVHQMMSAAHHQILPDLPTQFTLEDKARQTLATVIGGMILIVGAYFSYRNLRAAEKNAEVAQDKHITDRFTAAVSNLGSTDIALRLGGIYALERIATQSSRDHWTVMEVLSATVRDTRKLPHYDEDLADAYDEDLSDAYKDDTPTDTQAILTVIGRRNSEQDQGKILNLSATNLSWADLSRAYLSQVDLSQTILFKANLSKAELSAAKMQWTKLFGADLSEAVLSKANLSGAKLSEAKLVGARLCQTDLSYAYLSKADFSWADLSDAKLVGANLLRAKLVGAKLVGAKLSEANLSGSYLTEADLSGAKLLETNLSGADLVDAKIIGADLTKAVLTNAKLLRADLSGVILAGAEGLTQEQVNYTKGKAASLPEGIVQPLYYSHGPIPKSLQIPLPDSAKDNGPHVDQ